MLYHVAVLLFALLSVVYANKRIAGGTLAVDGQFPHMVSMLIYYEGSEFPFICSGGILTKNIILTAAHCTFEETLRPKYIDIFYGSAHNEPPQAKTAAISYLSSHPDFNKAGKTENDIALIRLNEDLVFDSKTKPMQLASEAPAVEDVLTIAGWGRTPDSDPPADLLYVDLEVRPDSECKAFFDSYGYVPNTQVCAEGGPKDNCVGDSGGPFTKEENNEFVAYGVVSFGTAECGVDPPAWGAYTRVSAYLPWIEASLARLASKPEKVPQEDGVQVTVVEAPLVDTTETPTTSEPTTAEPTTSEPTTAEPTTSEPTTPEPTTSAPTTAEPTTSAPTTAPPTDEPTTAAPTTSEPTTSAPTETSPAPQETTAEPTTSEPSTTPCPTCPCGYQGTRIAKRRNGNPGCRECLPCPSEPTTLEPTTSEPSTSAPTTSAPTTVAPTETVEPSEVVDTTVAPTTQEPTSAASTGAPETSVSPSSEPPVQATCEPCPCGVLEVRKRRTQQCPQCASCPSTTEPTTVAPTDAPSTLVPSTTAPTSAPSTQAPTTPVSTSELTTTAPTEPPVQATCQPCPCGAVIRKRRSQECPQCIECPPTTAAPSTAPTDSPSVPNSTPPATESSTAQPVTVEPTEVPTTSSPSTSPVTDAPVSSAAPQSSSAPSPTESSQSPEPPVQATCSPCPCGSVAGKRRSGCPVCVVCSSPPAAPESPVEATCPPCACGANSSKRRSGCPVCKACPPETQSPSVAAPSTCPPCPCGAVVGKRRSACAVCKPCSTSAPTNSPDTSPAPLAGANNAKISSASAIESLTGIVVAVGVAFVYYL